MIKKKNQCRNCNNVILSQDSKLSGKCFYCRNYTKIQRLRMIEHDSMMEKMEKMPTNTNIQRYEKRKIREELLFGRQTFVKFGRVEKPTKYKEEEKLDLVAINLAIRDPETEKRIVWAKLNKGMLR